jgi:hypothetical protein
LFLVLGAAACAPRATLELGVQPPPEMSLYLAEGTGLQLRGELRGPFAGLGPRVQFVLLLVGDGRLRADLRYELRDRPQHDVILWTEGGIVSFDRRRGGFQELGETGALEFAGAKLQLGHVVFVTLGRCLPELPAQWSRQGSRWRTTLAGVELETRREGEHERPVQQHLRWRESGQDRRLTAYVRRFEPTPLGELPQRLELAGHGIRGRLHVELEHEVVAIDELVDFDPLRDR